VVWWHDDVSQRVVVRFGFLGARRVVCVVLPGQSDEQRGRESKMKKSDVIVRSREGRST